MGLAREGEPVERTERLALPARRGWRGGVLDQITEALTAVAEVCLHPIVVLPLFFAGLTTSTVTVGLAIAVVLAAAPLGMVPALLLERRTGLQTTALLGAAGGRALALSALAGIGALLSDRQPQLLGVAIALLALGLACGGFTEPLRRAGGNLDTPLSGRNRWFLTGTLAAVGGALLARPLLAGADASFPSRYLQLFLIAGFLFVLVAVILFVRQPLHTGDRAPRGWAALATMPDLLLNNLAYGRFACFRAIYAFGAIADPFYVLYATRELGAGGRTAAAYLLTLAAARAVAGAVWRGLGIGGGNRMVLQLAAFVRLLAPITALTLPPLLGAAALRDRLPSDGAASLVAFGLVFAAYGAASAGVDLAGPALQAASTTPNERPAAATLTALLLAGTAFIVVLGGLIVERLGFPLLFIAALMTGLIALLASGLVEEPHAVIRRGPQGERPITRRHRRAPAPEGGRTQAEGGGSRPEARGPIIDP